MKKRIPFRRVAPILLLVLAGPLAASEADTDRETALAHLDRTSRLFLGSLQGLSEAQLAYKAAEDKWSIAEVAEHVTASETFVREAVVRILEASDAAGEGARQDEAVQQFLTNRDQKFQAPEPLQPTGRYESVAKTIETFKAERAVTVELAGSDIDRRGVAGEHPAFGSLDVQGWLLFLSSHTERHTKQIEEVKADPGFPET